MTALTGQPAPDFRCSAVMPDGTINEEYRFADAIASKYAILFFYPLDFTFVCPSELIALDHRIDQFRERNVEIVGISVDSAFTHNAWRNTPLSEGGIGPVRYTLAADLTHAIARSYGVETAGGVALRAAFIIDREGVVRSATINDLPLGRNIDELIRLVDALQFHEAHGEVCPANWQKGDQGMSASPEGVSDYLAKHGDAL